MEENERKSKEVEITMLQNALRESDYKVMKCNEANLVGEPAPYDMAEVHKERQAMRDKINELQSELENDVN